jgi:hypothetical protein
VLRQLKRWLDPAGLEPVLYLLLLATGVTGTALALFMGKLFAAALLAAVCVGIYLRLKRGRVRENPKP